MLTVVSITRIGEDPNGVQPDPSLSSPTSAAEREGGNWTRAHYTNRTRPVKGFVPNLQHLPRGNVVEIVIGSSSPHRVLTRWWSKVALLDRF